MKGTKLAAWVVVLMFALGSVTFAWTAMYTVDPWQAGNSGNECAAASLQTGVTYEYHCKIDWGDANMSGAYVCPYTYDEDGNPEDYGDNTITITTGDNKYFDWSALYPIGAVIVKGGNAANIFAYDPQAESDTGLYAPPTGKKRNIPMVSHTTFCWNPEEEEWCWEDETAWAAGNRYVEQGNWATYTPYVANSTVTLYAGQTMDAGTVHFSEAVDGYVTITIALNEGWRFAPVDENVKIQDYAEAPSGNPSPGLFDWKGTADTSPFSIQVPLNNFYGVHVDVQHRVPCE